MKILLPVDGSIAANEAVDFVRSLAEDVPVDVVVLMVSFAPPQHAMQSWVSTWTEQEALHIQNILEQAKRLLDVECQSVSGVRGTGSVVSCILDQANQLRADLIVIGAKGHSALQRSQLGSVSDNVATRAECSVVVVRPGQSKMQRLDKILLAFDKSVASREAVTELMQLKLSRDTQISVVSVAQTPHVFIDDGYAPSPIPLTPDQIAPISDAAGRMAGQIAEQYPHTNAQTPVADHVGDAIVEAAEEARADVIVVGDAGQSLRGEYFLGSTSSYVLRHAACSVWISRHHWKSPASKHVSDAVAANRIMRSDSAETATVQTDSIIE